MIGRLSEAQFIAMLEGIQAGATMGAALWDVAGPDLLHPGEDSVEDPATMTVTVRLNARNAEFVRRLGADHDDMERFIIEAIAQARLVGINLVRRTATKEPGDGQGVVMMPVDAYRGSR